MNVITRNDCLILLKNLQEQGLDTSKQVIELVSSRDVPISVIKFINDNRQLDLTNFYERLRKNYNNKKSSLYINIVKETEDVNKVITTLSALFLQIMLYSRDLENKQIFLKHARADEINKVLALYLKYQDLTNCNKLIKIIKADIKVLESIR
jgi:hypothetical protein